MFVFKYSHFLCVVFPPTYNIHLVHRQKRFWKFFICELLNVLAVAINFNMVDWLLDGKFGLYGYEAIKYLMNKGDKENYIYNPMCHAFPTLVSYQFDLKNIISWET